MGALSSKLRSITAKNGDRAVVFFCPGCDQAHVVWYKGPVAWDWNGDVEKPTFSPSYRTYHPAHKKEDGTIDVPEKTICHIFVRNGIIDFLGDCAHKLAGQQIPIPDWPYSPGQYGGIDDE